MQNDVIIEGGAFADSGAPAHAISQNVVANVQALAEAFRAAGAPLIHIWYRELLTKSILVSAFALWGIVQIAPTMPDVAVLNDVVIALFVIDLAIIVSPWL